MRLLSVAMLTCGRLHVCYLCNLVSIVMISPLIHLAQNVTECQISGHFIWNLQVIFDFSIGIIRILRFFVSKFGYINATSCCKYVIKYFTFSLLYFVNESSAWFCLLCWVFSLKTHPWDINKVLISYFNFSLFQFLFWLTQFSKLLLVWNINFITPRTFQMCHHYQNITFLCQFPIDSYYEFYIFIKFFIFCLSQI